MLKRSLVFGFALVTLVGCRDSDRQVETTDSTTVVQKEPPGVTTTERRDDTISSTPDTSKVVTAPLTPVDPIEPDRLAAFLPSLDGYTPEDVQKETRIRSNMKFSRAWRVYKNGDKKVTVTINDYAYVPSNYLQYEQYRGQYLQDDNIERTESTRISGYEAVQTWLKKENRAEITLFPGHRYIVQLTADGMNDISEARHMLDQMDLSGLEGLK